MIQSELASRTMITVAYNIEYAHVYNSKASNGSIISKEQHDSILVAKRVIDNLTALGKTYCLSVLIDDYNEDVAETSEDYVYRELVNMGLPPDHVVRESSLAGKPAEALIASIADRFLHVVAERNEVWFAAESRDIHLWDSNPGHSLRRSFWDYVQGRAEQPFSAKSDDGATEDLGRRGSLRSKSQTILRYLAEDGRTLYTCPLLTLCWHLMRLGVQPFAQEANKVKSFAPKPFVGERLVTILPTTYLKVETTAVEILLSCRPRSVRDYRDCLEYHFF